MVDVPPCNPSALSFPLSSPLPPPVPALPNQPKKNLRMPLCKRGVHAKGEVLCAGNGRGAGKNGGGSEKRGRARVLGLMVRRLHRRVDGGSDSGRAPQLKGRAWVGFGVGVEG